MTDRELPNKLSDDILWGVEQIAAHIGRDRSKVYYLIRHGKIPAKKLGPKTIVGFKSQIDKALARVKGIA